MMGSVYGDWRSVGSLGWAIFRGFGGWARE